MKYTPEIIASSDLYYSIPIYQRLFEWSTENIITLLKDLKNSYMNSKDSDYYIGMLTSTNENELVDGQQRFTVMMLLGCALKRYLPEWNRFLGNNKQPRLQFLSRPHDNTYLQAMIAESEENALAYKNNNMKAGLNSIRIFLEENEKADNNFNCSDFAKYIFKHLSFFISALPNHYHPMDLNKYFERMNTSGRNLEQHEILKVKLLSCLQGNIDKYMQLWNLLAEIDVPLIRKRTYQNESEELFKKRKEDALKNDIHTIISGNILNGMNHNDNIKPTKIADVELSSTPPSKSNRSERDSRAVLRFSHLLLNTLYWKLGNNCKVNIDDFFNPTLLLTTFSKYLPYEGKGVNQDEIVDFMQKLLHARLALDICFIRTTEYGYSLDMNCPEDDENLKRLIMLESMIYVYSSNYTNYKWFGWLMESTRNGIPSVDKLYNELKKHDNDEHCNLPDLAELSYGEIRYWFWRLDFYIWENRKELFKDSSEFLKVAENYVFTRNRSIEHVAPQTPETDSKLKWEDTKSDKTIMNSFGNLVMISQGLNSALQNKSFEVKYAHVLAYCNGSKTGSIESLKLLMIYLEYGNKGWDHNTIKEHGEKMYGLLKESLGHDTPCTK